MQEYKKQQKRCFYKAQLTDVPSFSDEETSQQTIGDPHQRPYIGDFPPEKNKEKSSI